MPKVILKEGRERSLLNRHPWLFSGAIASMPECQEGAILPIFSAQGQFLAQAYFHPRNSIAGRVLSFTEEPVEEVLRKRLDRALSLRKPLGLDAERLINSEGDGIPGLIVDRYRDVLVIQINTWGIERLRDFFLRELQERLHPRTIYEKSTSKAREEEGLLPREGVVLGAPVQEVQIEENGLSYIVSIAEGQKTGFFLDQREMRRKICDLARGKRVLNCFCYTGGFSLSALKGGAKNVTSVDTSGSALKLLARNLERNGFQASCHTSHEEDVFSFLQRQQELPFDLVILDPPAFAKKRGDLESAASAYRELNRLVLQRLPPHALLLTASCSSYINKELFQQLLFQAAVASGRDLQILAHHSAALDHPISLYHPEGDYLKSLLLSVH